MSEVVLSLKNIRKEYPGVIALKDFSIDFYKGEVHALLGENGAGKSTLIKTIAGVIEPNEGKIIVFGNEYLKMAPQISRELGIEVIYQEFNLVGSLSAAENICLGKKFGKLVDYNQMEKIANDLFKQFNINIDPSKAVEELPSAQQQIVEIAKAVSKNAKILIMDEPSAPLTVSEVDCMFEIIRKLKDNGVTIIYISHRMEEIFEISDRVSIMRDGTFIKTLNTKDTNRDELIKLMVGRELKEVYPKRMSTSQEVLLELKNVWGNGVKDISFQLRKGEILGFSGLIGAGRTELARVIFGVEKKDKGSIFVKGEEVFINSPSEAIEKGIGLIPEDRKNQGCFLDMDIRWNISVSNLKKISKNMIVNSKEELKIADYYEKAMRIKTPSLFQDVKNLSGGNQQKVVISKTLSTNSNIVIFDEPTRGIDVGAKQEIYKLMNELAEEGMGIIMISSDMEELLGMSDRIIVISEGKISGEVMKQDFSQEHIIELASI